MNAYKGARTKGETIPQIKLAQRSVIEIIFLGKQYHQPELIFFLAYQHEYQ